MKDIDLKLIKDEIDNEIRIEDSKKVYFACSIPVWSYIISHPEVITKDEPSQETDDDNPKVA